MSKATRRDWFRGSAAAGLGLTLAPTARVLAAGTPPLKIIGTESFGLRIPFDPRVRENMLENYRRENIDRPAYFPWIVKLHTDAGLVGLGESQDDPRPHLARMQGRSMWEFLNDGLIGPGIMIAIYDLMAQAGGVPVAKLFSPQAREIIQHT